MARSDRGSVVDRAQIVRGLRPINDRFGPVCTGLREAGCKPNCHPGAMAPNGGNHRIRDLVRREAASVIKFFSRDPLPSSKLLLAREYGITFP